MDSFLDPIFAKIVEVLTTIFSTIIGIIFYNGVTTVIFGLLFFNLLGFYLMKLDKSIAKSNGEIKEKNKDKNEKELKKLLRKRISESSLLLTAFVGGSLGILGGMYVFRHKTQKPAFRVGVPIIIAFQIILIIYSLIKNLIVK